MEAAILLAGQLQTTSDELQPTTVIPLVETTQNQSTTAELGVNDGEGIFLMCCILLAAIASFGLNGSVLFTILKEVTLRQNTLYAILVCQVLCDLVTPVIYCPVAFFFIINEDGVLSDPLARTMSFLSQVICLLIPVHTLTLLAVERYFFICKPFRHHVYFKERRVAIYLACIVTAAAATGTYSVLTSDILQVRVILACRYKLGFLDNWLTGAIYSVVYGLGTIGLQSFCFVNIAGTAISQNKKTLSPAMVGMPNAKLPHLVMGRRIVQTITGVARLCGLFWFTWGPAMGIFTAVLAYRNRGLHISAGLDISTRYSFLILMTVVPVLNPLICIRNMVELRNKWLPSILGRNKDTLRSVPTVTTVSSTDNQRRLSRE